MISLLLSLGALLFLALGAGRLCARFRVPRVTGYLIVGLLAGPSLAGLLGTPSLLSEEQIASLEPINDMALGLIVLVIGGSFNARSMRRFGLALLAISGIEMLVTAVVVFAATTLAGASPVAAAFLGLMAMTTAPAATQMVIREYGSEGRLTDLTRTLIGLDNLVAIIAFVLLAHAAITPGAPPERILLLLGAPLGIGAAAGVLMALMDQRLSGRVERQLLGLAAVAALTGGCRLLGISPMLAALVSGAVLVNTSPHERRVLEDLGAIDYPLYVLFFLMAGAHLRLELLPEMGAVGVAYVLARAAGKLAGCRLGANAAHCEPPVRRWLGPAMMAQAGLAIGLAAALGRDWPGEGEQVRATVLASVVVFEGLGPLLTRLAVVRAGEVTVISLLTQRSPVNYAEGLHRVVDQFRSALGFPRSRQLSDPSEIAVSCVMRRNVETVPHDMGFDGILKAFGHSRYDRLPVVDDRSELVGVVQYSDVSEVLFDPGLRNLVVARDIATQEHLLLTPEDTLQTAMDGLGANPDHTYLLVVEPDNPRRLIGTVRYNDVLSAQRRG
jgi:Kef-type K+ transport system membrane component KefB/CBS domain-containing protein